MVYMAADNNLETYAIENINQMESVGSSSGMSVVVQIDRSPNYDRSNGNWTTTRRYHITRDTDNTTINSELIQDLGEVDMAEPQSLADFVQWATSAYPAEHYLLVLWDHGRGWQTRAFTPLALQREIKAIHLDETSNSEMSLADITQAMGQIPHMDIVLFDACLMGMTEVAYSIKDDADIMIASEENIPATGQPYDQVLSRIATNPAVSSSDLSHAIVDIYMDYAMSTQSGTLTQSAINLPALNQVISAADQLGRALLLNINTVRPAVRLAQEQTQHFDFDKAYYDDYKDLYDFANRINARVGSPDVRTAAQATMTAVNNAVLYQRNSGGQVSNSRGISIYLPGPGFMLPQYRNISFAQNTQWDEFLAIY